MMLSDFLCYHTGKLPVAVFSGLYSNDSRHQPQIHTPAHAHEHTPLLAYCCGRAPNGASYLSPDSHTQPLLHKYTHSDKHGAD